jgi:hypothetical protein
MADTSNEPATTDPDNIPETLCIGKFHVGPGPGPLVTLTFTNVRTNAIPLLENGSVVQESVVRARIVTTGENLAALRDLLNQVVKDSGPGAVGAGGSSKLN